MPRYQLPANLDLKHFTGELEKTYKTTKGSSPQRQEYLELVHIVNAMLENKPYQDEQKILLALGIYELEKIEKEYDYSPLSPVYSKGHIYSTGSKLYSDILHKFGVSEQNQLNDDERLIYLLKLYLYIDENKDSFVTSPAWRSAQTLLIDIESILKRIKEREYSRIEMFSCGIPKLAIVKNNLYKILPDYEKASANRWFANNKRKSSILFLSMIDETCDQAYPINIDVEKLTGKNNINDINYIKSFNTRMGAFIFGLNEINNEYSILSSKRSYLFRQYLQSVNAKSLKTIDLDQQILWLRALSNHLASIRQVPDYFLRVKHDWTVKGLSKIDEYQSRIDAQLVKLEERKATPSRCKVYIKSGTSYATQFGLGMVVTKYAANAIIPLVPAVGGIAASMVAGPVGMVVYGTAGTLIATQLGRLVQEKLLPEAVAGVYGKVLEKIGDTVAGTTVNAVSSAFSVSKEGLRQLISGYRKKTKDDFLDEWIDTLINLPDSVMSRSEKDQIKSLILPGADEQEKIISTNSI